MSNNHEELKICGPCWVARHEDLEFHRCEPDPIHPALRICYCPCKGNEWNDYQRRMRASFRARKPTVLGQSIVED